MAGEEHSVSFDDFCRIYKECRPEPQENNFKNLFLKFRDLPEDNIRELLGQLQFDSEQPVTAETLVPRVKSKPYLEHVQQQLKCPAALPHTFLNGTDLAVLLFSRTGTQRDPRGGYVHSEGLSLDLEATTFNEEQFHRDLAVAMRLAAKSTPRVKELEPIIAIYDPEFAVVLARLLLPSFVAFLRDQLGCTVSDSLIVVPFSKQKIYAARSSDSIQCCALGDFISEEEAAEQQDFVSSTPFEVCADLNEEEDEFEALARGHQPVTLKPYLNWGANGNPRVRFVGEDGVIRCHVPTSDADADSIMRSIQAGHMPQDESRDYPSPGSHAPSEAMQQLSVQSSSNEEGAGARTEGGASEEDEKFCAGCGWGGVELQRCARCKSVRYCSQQCQRQHWKVHKGECKAAGT